MAFNVHNHGLRRAIKRLGAHQPIRGHHKSVPRHVGERYIHKCKTGAGGGQHLVRISGPHPNQVSRSQYLSSGSDPVPSLPGGHQKHLPKVMIVTPRRTHPRGHDGGMKRPPRGDTAPSKSHHINGVYVLLGAEEARRRETFAN
jgi:hypothetical protein